ncbi:MAG: PepSY domain-containing protein [Chloroflexota bacterium]|nr:PepSY domain-containing protein [Gammaproteobacteria bacterium]MDE2687321.1 PepSY domain-containing protein [Chloroflexota bacterium]
MKVLAILHRWLGVALFLLFGMWFATGAIMMYVPFPSLPASEAIAQSPPIKDSQLGSLPDTLRAAGLYSLRRLRLRSFDERPLLITERETGGLAAHFADTGEAFEGIDAEEAGQLARRFANQAVREVEGPIDYDQWVVHQQFDPFRPMFRVSLNDSAGTQLYVSQTSAEVVQRTTRQQRQWNSVGAVLHWIYPTVIRKDWRLWDGLVWWLSLAGLVGALSGVALGVLRLRKRRDNNRLGSPFVGWLWLHHVLGLVFGVVVVTWIFSGWLSMDHGRLFSEPNPTALQIGEFRGLSLNKAFQGLSEAALNSFSGAAEVEISAIDGKPLIITRRANKTDVTVIDGSDDLAPLSPATVASAIASAWPGNSIVNRHSISPTDSYGNLREGALGPDVMRFVLNDDGQTWVHVDMSNGSIVSVMDRSRRTYRWLYNGLHSLDFPGLADRRPLWDILMLVLLAGGFAFSVTAAVIGYRRLILTFRSTR